MNNPVPDPNPSQQPTPPAEEAGTEQVKNVPTPEMTRFVTSIKNAEQQVGEHVIQALQHGDTVAVLTTVVVGPGGQQHIVSAALDDARTAQVNALLHGARQVREEEELCVGFHCLIKPKEKPAEQ